MHVKIRLDLHITSFLGAAAHRCLADCYAQFDKLSFNSAVEAVSKILWAHMQLWHTCFAHLAVMRCSNFVPDRTSSVHISLSLPH